MGVASLNADNGGSFSRIGTGGGLMLDPGELYPESSDKSKDPRAKLSSSGVSRGTIDFQVWAEGG